MTGRTCQLCGKPLSRFAVGTGGDFCSREHRNQFRLRLGMDRLNEANKVASLMRRRENAKAFPAAQLASNCKAVARPANYLRVPVRQAPPPSLSALVVSKEQPRLPSTSGKLLATQRAATLTTSSLRMPNATGSFTGRHLRPAIPPRSQEFPVQLCAAGNVALHSDCLPARRHLHEVAAIGWPHRVSMRVPDVGNRVYHEPQCARSLSNFADRGRELRVSGGIGFRLPARRVRQVSLDGPRVAPLRNSSRVRIFNPVAGAKDPMARETSIQIVARGVFGPHPPSKNGAVQFRWPSAILGSAGLARQTDLAPRTSSVVWTASSAPFPPELRLTNGAAQFPAVAPPAPSASVPAPRVLRSVHRLSMVNFQPKDTPFEHWPTALYGTLVSGMQFGLAPARKQESTATAIEEHFDAGLQNWMGGTSDWKVDVAGVRAGSLALYTPSLEVRDYLMEFLARIESRSVSWVFRAAGFTDYYQATLAVAPGGGYEFRRHAVIGGVAESPVTRPATTSSSAPSAKAAVTLRTRVMGDSFTVFLDGQAIDTWTDSRLATGGIGFVGAPDDRARLYWVKLTPAGHIHKENSKQ